MSVCTYVCLHAVPQPHNFSSFYVIIHMATETARVLSAVNTILQPESVPFLKSLVDPTFQWLQRWGQLHAKRDSQSVHVHANCTCPAEHVACCIYSILGNFCCQNFFRSWSVTR